MQRVPHPLEKPLRGFPGAGADGPSASDAVSHARAGCIFLNGRAPTRILKLPRRACCYCADDGSIRDLSGPDPTNPMPGTLCLPASELADSSRVFDTREHSVGIPFGIAHTEYTQLIACLPAYLPAAHSPSPLGYIGSIPRYNKNRIRNALRRS